MTTNNLKLGVQVVHLMPKDGQGSLSAFVELLFDGQKFRTTIKEKDLNPVWDESFYFNIFDPSILRHLALDVYVYNCNKATNSRSFFGKVSLSRTSFVPHSDAVVLYYPLEKRFIFSCIKGKLGLKVFLTGDPTIKSSSHAETEAPPLQIVRMHSASAAQPVDSALKETSPYLGGGQVVGERIRHPDKTASAYDLVEQMQFLYVRVVKARYLSHINLNGSLDLEVRIGNHGLIKHLDKNDHLEWNLVFAFSMDLLQGSDLEVKVKYKDLIEDDFVGIVSFFKHKYPFRVPPDSPVPPEWYQLEGKYGVEVQGQLRLAVWLGTQADEEYSKAWHSDSASIDSQSSAASALLCSKNYLAPRLWYVRVNVIEAQDLVPTEKNRFPEVFCKAEIGHQIMKTKLIQAQALNALWNEDLLFVAAEPFDDNLVITVSDRVAPGKDEIIGRVTIPLTPIDQCVDDRLIPTRWFRLEKPVAVDIDQLKKEKFAGRLHCRVCLDGFDESTHYSSDLCPTEKSLWKPTIAVLELGILSVEVLHPLKTRGGRGTADTYCVAKYGRKWVRTRTRVDSLSPKFNEQYVWDVFDRATVLTVGVFDNCQIGEKESNGGHKDVRIGKVRIPLCTLETHRIYKHSYPLHVLQPNGVKEMGMLQLAIRFTSTSFANMMCQYSRPLLPKMHYVTPFTVMQQDMLCSQAMNIVAMRLGQAEPPLQKEVVEYMSDADAHLWSMRRSKANFFRLRSCFSGLFAVGKWFGDICSWRNPITTVLVHVLFLILVCFWELILPTVLPIVFVCMYLFWVWSYMRRPGRPPQVDTKISNADTSIPDELDEEFDTFPTSKSPELLRLRYDRLRSVAGRIQTVVGDIATQGERLQALLSWQDPCATSIFMMFCILAAVVLYVTPFQVIAALTGFYVMRYPRFNSRLHSVPINFFRRLPSKTESML